MTVAAVLLAMPWAADARSVADASGSEEAIVFAEQAPGLSITQRGCMSLSQAVDSVRRGGNVERVISAETRGKVHHIKVLTKDGKVKTHRIPGC
jgi:hypothetical protein